MAIEFSLADLLTAGVPVDSSESVAILLRLAPYATEHPLGAFPSLDDVYLTEEGIRLENTDRSRPDARSAIGWLGSTLHALLAYSDAGERVMPLGLQFLVSRAVGHRFGEPRETMEAGPFPPITSVSDLVRAATRFAPPDPGAAIHALYERARSIAWSST